MQQEYIARAAWKQGMMGAVSAITAVLSQRLIVLVAVLGGIWLTFLALDHADAYRLGALGIYCLGVVGTSVWLAGR